MAAPAAQGRPVRKRELFDVHSLRLARPPEHSLGVSRGRNEAARVERGKSEASTFAVEWSFCSLSQSCPFAHPRVCTRASSGRQASRQPARSLLAEEIIKSHSDARGNEQAASQSVSQSVDQPSNQPTSKTKSLSDNCESESPANRDGNIWA